jgi:hypothetical protein
MPPAQIAEAQVRASGWRKAQNAEGQAREQKADAQFGAPPLKNEPASNLPP